MIVNWMSLPTGVGEFVHWLLEIPFDLPKQPFINVARIIGGDRAAGDRGPAVVGGARRRAGRDPAGRHRAAGGRGALARRRCPGTSAGAWRCSRRPRGRRRALSWLVFFSLMLVIVYYPNGEDALYNWPYLAACAALSALAAVSLQRVDPLHLRLRSPADRPPSPTSSQHAEQRSG